MMKTKGKIRKYIEDYKFNSLFIKNLLLLLLLIIVPLTGAFFLGYYAYGNMQKNEMKAYHEKITADIYSEWERILKEAGTELSYIGFNSNVELYLYDTAEIRQLNYSLQNIQELIKMPILAKDYIDGIYVYSCKSEKVVSMEGISNYKDFSGKPGFDRYLLGGDEGPRLLVIQDNDLGYWQKKLALFHSVKYGSDLNGVTAMNMNLKDLKDEVSVPPYFSMYLTDGETILFSDNIDLVGDPVEEIEHYDTVVHNGTAFMDRFSVSSKVASLSGLEVITFMEMGGYHNQLSVIWNFMAVFLLIMLLVTLLLSVLISVRIFRPIGAIVSTIRENQNILVGEEELFQEKDELEYVLKSISKTAHVKQDIDKELSERMRLLKKAQAVALQSQINPHFLNNTLDTVNWMAIGLLGGKNDISEMIGALSKMLRMALENTDSIIPMSMEIEHCKMYLEIQKKRYEDKFEVIWAIEPEVYAVKTIRIILQPIVENAIYHGIKHLSNHGIIKISGEIKDGVVEITVADNGLGMTPEELENVRETMRSDRIRESSHIGVANVDQRLKLYFGEEYGIFMDSGEGVGTKVTIRLPEIS